MKYVFFLTEQALKKEYKKITHTGNLLREYL